MRSTRGFFRACTAVVTSVCLTAQLIQVAPAMAAPPPVRVELTDKRTPYTKTFDNGDGTLTLESYAEPIHYRGKASGNYEQIDSSLVATDTPRGKGVTNRANAFSIHLPDTEGESPVGFTYEDAAIYLSPQGRPLELPVAMARAESTSAPEPGDSRSRRYRNAFAGADVVYTSEPRGLKETIVLDYFLGRNVFSYDVECVGVVPSLEASGSISFTHTTTGRVVFEMPPPFMEDSSEDENGQPAYSDDVHYELKQAGRVWRLDIVADRDWLRDPARVFPVKIDPTTYFVGGHWCYDSYVSSSSPSTNYGSAQDLAAGRASTTTGTYRAFLRPELGDVRDYGYSVLKAELSLYCYYRPVTTTTPIRLARVTSSWTDTGITWNNQPGISTSYQPVDDVGAGQFATWDVTPIMQDIMVNDAPNYGFRLSSDNESGSANTLCWFLSGNAPGGQPYLEVTYTSRPEVELVAPSAEVPVGTHTGGDVHAHWTYHDALDKAQSAVQVQVSSAPPAVSWDSGKTAIGADDRARSAVVPSEPGRYWMRMRVWGTTTEEGAAGLEAPSEWTEWRPFERKAVTATPSVAGLHAPAAASDPVGAGLVVDLTTGRLKGSRTDFAGVGQGGPLTYGTYYDSSITADEGLGPGWRIAEPKLTKHAQVLYNAGFELVPTNGNNPPGWWYSNDLVTARADYWDSRSGQYYLMIGQSQANGFFSAYVSSHDAGTAGLRVYPGERLSANAWVMTHDLIADTTKTEHGALMKLHFYDAAGAYVSSAVSSGYRPGATTPGTWRNLGLESVVPEGAYYAKLNLEACNIKGYTYWDDVSLLTHGLDYTDADGTKRSFAQVGPGVYTRDPLEPSVRFTRVNALLGARGASGKGTDGVVDIRTKPWDYDTVAWNASGTSFLQYELLHPELLEGIDLYLWDGAENTPRIYTYAIDVSQDGSSWERVVPQTTGRSWVKHTFSPRRVRYVRVVALGNTANASFHIMEIEGNTFKLSDGTVCADSAGRIVAHADPSGNPTFITRNLSGKITRIADNTENRFSPLVRALELNWSSSQVFVPPYTWQTVWRLDSLTNRGVSSSGAQTTEAGVVSFASTAGEYRVVRSHDGTQTAVATYTYDAQERISGVRDADGIGFTIGYDASGRVATVTRSGAPTETVTTYTYGTVNTTTRKATIATSAGGVAAPSRVITWRDDLGGQPILVKIDGTESADPETSVVYDEYGQVWKVVDPRWRYVRTERDGRGNVLVAADHDSAGVRLRQTRAEYTNDHVVRAFDVNGNESRFEYDTAWRPVSELTVSADVAADGAGGAQAAYDEWGNQVVAAPGDSTAFNLLRNGTFELDPLLAGNGWDGKPPTGTTSESWATVGSLSGYLGQRYLKLANTQTPPSLTSEKITLRPTTVYSLSADHVTGWGEVVLAEYDAQNVLVRETPVLQCADALGTTSGGGVVRLTGNVETDSTTTYGYVRIRRPLWDLFGVDNVRLELASAASPASIVENQSMERIASGLPQAWHRRSTSYTTAVHEQSSDEMVSGRFSAHIEHTASSANGYFYSDWMYVQPGEVYTAAASVKTAGSTGGADVVIEYYDSNGGIVGSLSSVVPALMKGTQDWRRYVAEVTVPSGAARMRVFLRHQAGGGSAYFDAVTVVPGNQTSTTAFDAGTRTFAVSSESRSGVAVTSATDARGRSTATGVIPRGQSANTPLLSRAYDGLGRLDGVTVEMGAAPGITAAFTYTDAGRLTGVVDPLGRAQTIDYDAAGRVTGSSSALDIRTGMEYDTLDRVARTLAPAQGSEPTKTATSIAYDGLGRVDSTTYHDASGAPYATITPTYDLTSRVTGTAITGSGVSPSSSALTYDSLYRVIRAVASGPAGAVETDIVYNTASQPTKTTYDALGAEWVIDNTYGKTLEQRSLKASSITWEFGYGPAGALTIARSPQSRFTRSYDTAGRLVEARAGTGPSPTTGSGVFDSRLTYDSRDRIASVQLSGMELYTDSYTYDPAGRLAAWTRSGTGATSATYAWDAACNLTSKTQGGVTTTFVSDADDRLVSATAGTNVTTYTHDLYGRRTSAVSPTGTTTYGWNPLGQLTSLATAQSTAVYSYGATGMRERAVVTQGGTTKTTESVWQGGRLVAERDDQTTLYRYTYAPDGTPLALTKGYGDTAVTYAYHTDAQGSVVAITDPAGTVVASYRYDAFGAVTYTGGSDPALAARNPLRYRGYYLDAATGLYYLPARYYDPATARFLSQDPVPPSAGDPLTLNAYAYCVGDPVNFADPDGARHEAGGGAGRVHDEAIKLAKSGHLKEAKKVQARYRAKITLNYRMGYRYEDAAYSAYSQAEYYARSIWAGYDRVGDGTTYGKFNLKLRPSPTSGVKLGLETFSVIPFIGWIGDAGLAAFNVHNWVSGNGTLGDLIWEVAGLAPAVGDAIDATLLVMDYITLVSHEGMGMDVMPIYASRLN